VAKLLKESVKLVLSGGTYCMSCFVDVTAQRQSKKFVL